MRGRPGIGGSEQDRASSRTAKAPGHQGFHPPKDTRYTTCQVRGGGAQDAERGGRRVALPRFLPPQDAAARAEQRGTGRAGKPRPTVGRPDARTAAGRSPASERERAGSGQSRTPGWAQAVPAAALWTHGGSLAARRRVFSYKPGWQARQRRRRRRNLPASRATSARRPAHCALRRRWRGGAEKAGPEDSRGRCARPGPWSPAAAAQPNQTGCPTTFRKSPSCMLPVRAAAFYRN